MYRDDGRRVSVYNEGLTSYLFDASAAETVRAALDASRSEGAESPALLELAASGTLVMYELCQDDPIEVEVSLGDPLTAAEKKPAKWMRVVRARIDLPSGQLHVESGASLEDPDDSPPGVVDVPPGTYELALHRVSWGKMEGRRYEAYDGPGEVVTLRPWPTKKKWKPTSSLIHYGDAARGPWVGRYEISDGAFRGEVIGCRENERERLVCINLDLPAFESLGLERGQHLELIAGRESHVVLCHGRMNRLAATWFLGEAGFRALAELHPGLLVGYASSTGVGGEPAPTEIGAYRDYDYFVVSTLAPPDRAASGEDGAGSLFSLERGAPVELRVHSEPFFTLDPSILDDWQLDGDDLHGRVLSCTPTRLYLNLDLRALGRLGFQDGDTLELEIGDERRVVFDKRYLGGRWFDVLERATLAPLPEDLAKAEALEDEVYNEHGELQTAVEGWEEKVTRLEELKLHPDDRSHPPLSLDFAESSDHPGREMMLCQSAFALGPCSPDAIRVEADVGTRVVIRKLEDGSVRR